MYLLSACRVPGWGRVVNKITPSVLRFPSQLDSQQASKQDHFRHV